VADQDLGAEAAGRVGKDLSDIRKESVMTRMMYETANRLEGNYSEGGLARPIEKATAQLPSDTWLWLAYGSIATSLCLKLMGRDKDALFVGQWAAPFLIHGVYNKLVKQLGHDRNSLT
jgi:hypothetical protein